jgi:hypothetical protein
MVKVCAIWLPALAIGLTAVGCEPTVQEFEAGQEGKLVAVEGRNENGTATEYTNDDEFTTKELLKDKADYAEAKEWLLPKYENHKVEGDYDAIVKLVDDLYAAGAAKVYAIGTKEEGTEQVVDMFVAELPTDAAKRKKVIKVHNNFWKKWFEDEDDAKEAAATDTAQKYLVFNLDP